VPSCASQLVLGQRHSFTSITMSRSPRSPPLRVRVDGGYHLIVGFAASPVVCQHTDSFSPCYVYPSGPSDGSRSLTPYAPGVGASDQRFWLLPSLCPSRAGLVSHMAQAKSTTQTTRLPRAVSTGSTSFQSSHSHTHSNELVSFEPLLPLLTCRCSSPFILLFDDLYRCPALALASSRKLSHSGIRLMVR